MVFLGIMASANQETFCSDSHKCAVHLFKIVMYGVYHMIEHDFCVFRSTVVLSLVTCRVEC